MPIATRTKLLLRRGALILAGVIASVSGSVANAESLEIVQLSASNFGEDEAFLNDLASRVRAAGLGKDFSARDFDIGRKDLNGDGVEELLVSFFGIPWCGGGQCETYSYRKVAGTWQFSGSVSALEAGNVSRSDRELDLWYEVAVRPRKEGGWHILSDHPKSGGDCDRYWIEKTNDASLLDPIEQPVPLGSAGYFGVRCGSWR